MGEQSGKKLTIKYEKVIILMISISPDIRTQPLLLLRI
ncbi:hypothetical protein RINTHH_15310 [Richelia intracellularis HH01]|uniref:Uncharacterized protein n=1 Tax=Richelia intracellularis HH01 TaxID=1165094 RepID=M1X5X9_9NOST|nr:hypothetical protein RINTHH_15310 [Richelia intracellularis HH01]